MRKRKKINYRNPLVLLLAILFFVIAFPIIFLGSIGFSIVITIYATKHLCARNRLQVEDEIDILIRNWWSLKYLNRYKK